MENEEKGWGNKGDSHACLKYVQLCATCGYVGVLVCMLQCVAACCKVLQCVVGSCRGLHGVAGCCRVWQGVAVCCSVL